MKHCITVDIDTEDDCPTLTQLQFSCLFNIKSACRKSSSSGMRVFKFSCAPIQDLFVQQAEKMATKLRFLVFLAHQFCAIKLRNFMTSNLQQNIEQGRRTCKLLYFIKFSQFLYCFYPVLCSFIEFYTGITCLTGPVYMCNYVFFTKSCNCTYQQFCFSPFQD